MHTINSIAGIRSKNLARQVGAHSFHEGQVAAVGIQPGKAEAHRKDRNTRNIVEFITRSCPSTLTGISAGILER